MWSSHWSSECRPCTEASAGRRRGMRRHAALGGSVLLAILVVAAAGIVGTTHFSGPRWLPHWKLSKPLQAPRRLPSVWSTLPQRPATTSTAGRFPLGTVMLWTVVAIPLILIAVLLWRRWTGRLSRAATTRHSVAVSTTSEVLT